MAAKNRRLGSLIAEPITNLYSSRRYDHLIFVEEDHKTAVQTRAAVLMFIKRNHMDLTTSVKGDEVWVMKDKDYPGKGETVDLRMIDIPRNSRHSHYTHAF